MGTIIKFLKFYNDYKQEPLSKRSAVSLCASGN